MVHHSLSHYDYQPYVDPEDYLGTDTPLGEKGGEEGAPAVTQEELLFLQQQMPVRIYQVTWGHFGGHFLWLRQPSV